MNTTYESAPPPGKNRQHQKTPFRKTYAMVPQSAASDATAIQLMGWRNSRAWGIVGPTKGFVDSFSQYSVEVFPGGGTRASGAESDVESVLFVTRGRLQMTLDGEAQTLREGSYAYLAPGAHWGALNTSDETVHLQWIRKAYIPLPGCEATSIVAHEHEIRQSAESAAAGGRSTKQLLDPDNLAYDMLMEIVTLNPNGLLPFAETHAMERSIFVLSGRALYKLNEDWVQVTSGDSLRLHAFSPQACYVSGPDDFRYLQYKAINRQCRLT
ncbi:cupin domain-containing protein [Paenarthrobacter sp. NPDC092416]|uniref:cupin domain-containing protein n=1 Tax=Paenarthrobacter sp. NPDC092416 TaxID=3364386 RepID=UPI003812B32F